MHACALKHHGMHVDIRGPLAGLQAWQQAPRPAVPSRGPSEVFLSVWNGISLHCPDLASFLSSWGPPVHTVTYDLTVFSNGHGQVICACPPCPESVSISEQEDPRGYRGHRV